MSDEHGYPGAVGRGEEHLAHGVGLGVEIRLGLLPDRAVAGDYVETIDGGRAVEAGKLEECLLIARFSGKARSRADTRQVDLADELAGSGMNLDRTADVFQVVRDQVSTEVGDALEHGFGLGDDHFSRFG